MQKKWYQTWWAISLMVLFTFVFIGLVAFGFYVFNFVGKINRGEIINPNSQTANKPKIFDPGGEDNYWLGASSSPRVTIVVFSDFACPFCRESFGLIRQITYLHPDIKVIFRDFPIHEESSNLAMAARCAGEQNLFWSMHDKLFQNQGVKTTEELNNLANQIGADTNKYQKCFADKKYFNQIQKDYLDGQRLGIEGTPTWFFNGQKLTGVLTKDNIDNIINEIK